jgi:hypothetical protein
MKCFTPMFGAAVCLLSAGLLSGCCGSGGAQVWSEVRAVSEGDKEAFWELDAKPGPEHRRLAALVGTWQVAITVSTPGEPLRFLTATSEISRGDHGLFITERATIQRDDLPPMVETMVTGYSAGRKRYECVDRNDNSSSQDFYAGNFDAERGLLVLTGSQFDIERGEVPVKIEITPVKDGKYTATMSFMHEPGKWTPTVVWAYRRVADGRGTGR